jgi:DNA repair protein RadC
MRKSSDGAVEYRTRIMDMPATSRPRERLLEVGAENLSDQELLAILLRTGSEKENVIELATRLITEFGGLAGLARADIATLRGVHGLGLAKAAEIHAALHLGIRANKESPAERRVIRQPEDVLPLCADMISLDHERLRIVRVNSCNGVLGQDDVYHGSVNSAQVRISELFGDAIKEKAVGIVIIHNHPSGDPTPSPDDIQLTKQAIEAGVKLDIDVLDHIIVVQGGHVSMKERGLAFA